MIRTFVHPDGLEQRLAVADLLVDAGDLVVEMIAGRGAPLVYSDPPWNPGNEKYWRRHAGASPPDSYDRLLDAWCGLVARIGPRDVFCEQSTQSKHRDLFFAAVERCEAWRLPLLEQWTVYYGTPGPGRDCVRPNVLLHFGSAPLATDPSGMRGVPMTRRVFEGIDLPHGSLVVDPCMGKGMTSRLAHERGWNVVGTELNSRRLDYTIAWLMKRGYEERA